MSTREAAAPNWLPTNITAYFTGITIAPNKVQFPNEVCISSIELETEIRERDPYKEIVNAISGVAKYRPTNNLAYFPTVKEGVGRVEKVFVTEQPLFSQETLEDGEIIDVPTQYSRATVGLAGGQEIVVYISDDLTGQGLSLAAQVVAYFGYSECYITFPASGLINGDSFSLALSACLMGLPSVCAYTGVVLLQSYPSSPSVERVGDFREKVTACRAASFLLVAASEAMENSRGTYLPTLSPQFISAADIVGGSVMKPEWVAIGVKTLAEMALACNACLIADRRVAIKDDQEVYMDIRVVNTKVAALDEAGRRDAWKEYAELMLTKAREVFAFFDGAAAKGKNSAKIKNRMYKAFTALGVFNTEGGYDEWCRVYMSEAIASVYESAKLKDKKGNEKGTGSWMYDPTQLSHEQFHKFLYSTMGLSSIEANRAQSAAPAVVFARIMSRTMNELRKSKDKKVVSYFSNKTGRRLKFDPTVPLPNILPTTTGALIKTGRSYTGGAGPTRTEIVAARRQEADTRRKQQADAARKIEEKTAARKDLGAAAYNIPGLVKPRSKGGAQQQSGALRPRGQQPTSSALSMMEEESYEDAPETMEITTPGSDRPGPSRLPQSKRQKTIVELESAFSDDEDL